MAPVPAMIVTISQNQVILHNGLTIPVCLPTEQARLLRTINGKTIIVGRKTFFALHASLPKCRTIVLSKDQDLLKEGYYRDYEGFGVWFVDSLKTAHLFASGLAQQHGQSEYFILGGLDIFRQILSQPLSQDNDAVKRLYLTTILQPAEQTSLSETKPLTLPALNAQHWQEYYNEKNESAHSESRPHHFQILNKAHT